MILQFVNDFGGKIANEVHKKIVKIFVLMSIAGPAFTCGTCFSLLSCCVGNVVVFIYFAKLAMNGSQGHSLLIAAFFHVVFHLGRVVALCVHTLLKIVWVLFVFVGVILGQILDCGVQCPSRRS